MLFFIPLLCFDLLYIYISVTSYFVKYEEARARAKAAEEPRKPQGLKADKWPIKEALDVPKTCYRFVAKAAREITT